ncbi:MAG: crotonase/enoyl-CoA hydratase family protein [Aquiluna sp.]
MSMKTRITTETRGHVFLIGLNRPDKMNAADEQMLHELSLAYGELDRNPDLRVGLVFAHGDHFTAGLDLNDVGPKLAAGNLQMVPEGGLDPWGMSTRQVSKPVVMATKGTCFTLGVELALASEIVIAATDSKFAQLEVSRGIMPFGGATLRFPKAAGHAGAMRYLLTGDSFNAEQALKMNFVTEVCEPGKEYAIALTLAEKIASQAPLAVQATLASARAVDSEAEKAHVFRRLAALMQTKDVARGMEAFVTKQSAKFEGN